MKKKNYTFKKKDISELYVSIYWMGNFFGKMTGIFCFHYLSSFFFRKIKMTSTDFHVVAIDRLWFVCGNIIMKYGHHVITCIAGSHESNF